MEQSFFTDLAQARDKCKGNSKNPFSTDLTHRTECVIQATTRESSCRNYVLIVTALKQMYSVRAFSQADPRAIIARVVKSLTTN